MKTLNTSVRFTLLFLILMTMLAASTSAMPCYEMDMHDQLISSIAPSYMESDIDIATGGGIGSITDLFPESAWLSDSEYFFHVLILLFAGGAVVLKSEGSRNFLLG